MADEKDPNEATTKADTYHRHDPDPEKWEEAVAVTGRPADVFAPNSTLAKRAAERGKGAKEVKEEQAEDKAVTSAATKARKPARKK